MNLKFEFPALVSNDRHVYLSKTAITPRLEPLQFCNSSRFNVPSVGTSVVSG